MTVIGYTSPEAIYMIFDTQILFTLESPILSFGNVKFNTSSLY